MAYSSDDDFTDELPDIQLLLEQRSAKGKKGVGAAATAPQAAELLPPSLFDPVTPPKPKHVPKPKSQLSKVEPKSKLETARKHKGTTVAPRNTSPRVPKVKMRNVTIAKKQITKATAQEIAKKTIAGEESKGHVAYPEAISPTIATSENSDYVSAAESVPEKVEPAPRRRRLIQKKYLPSSDEGEGEGEEGKEQKAPNKLQRGFVDLTSSDSEGVPSLANPPKPQVISTISEDEKDDGFVLRYSPPRSSKPRKIVAPPTSAKEPTGRSKLSPPTKKTPRLPPSQHRKSSDAFWDQGITNAWIDGNTTRKAADDLWDQEPTGEENGDIFERGEEASSEEEEKRLPTAKRTSSKAKPKEPKEKTETKRAFNAQKKQLAEEFFRTVDDKIGNGEVSRKAAATGGVKITWSKTLRTTAGTAKWKAERLQNISAQAALEHPMSTERVNHHATIELADKVVDSREKLYNTMCHEYCHLANYMISYVRQPAHGAEFKRWAAKCSREFAHLGVIVTTKHSYEIDAKFKWTCQTIGCGQVYKRHSKSIDITRSRCGVCKVGVLLQTHPPLKEKRPITGYQTFMKENFARIKAQNPGIPQKDIMKIVAQAYRDAKVTELGELGGDFVEAREKEGDLETLLGGLKV